jgi:PPOX class probable F420-dependent enzyme
VTSLRARSGCHDVSIERLPIEPLLQKTTWAGIQKMNTVAGLAAFDGKKYLNLETYRKSGTGVRTPVWFAAALSEAGAANLYVYSVAGSGKAKRLRHTGAVRIAPCDARGNVTGPWIDARASIVGGDEFERGMRLLNRKYWPVKQILDLSVLLFPRHQRVMISIQMA